MSTLLLMSALLLATLLINLSSPLPSSSSSSSSSSSVDPERNGLSTPQGMLLEEDKIRLGSTPPTCYNRCNDCNPCMAVQVPTMPGRDQIRPGFPRKKVDFPMFSGRSNYKPLDWKCRCQDRLFNP